MTGPALLAAYAAYLAVVVSTGVAVGRLVVRRTERPVKAPQVAVAGREPHPTPVPHPLDPEALRSCGEPVGDSVLEFWCSPKCAAAFQRDPFGRPGAA